MKNKLTVTFQVTIDEDKVRKGFKFYLTDLLVSSVLPALDAEFVAGSMEVKKARG